MAATTDEVSCCSECLNRISTSRHLDNVVSIWLQVADHDEDHNDGEEDRGGCGDDCQDEEQNSAEEHCGYELVVGNDLNVWSQVGQ
jgi:hypothetical protein